MMYRPEDERDKWVGPAFIPYSAKQRARIKWEGKSPELTGKPFIAQPYISEERLSWGYI